jgi:hypothetical protein
MKVLDLACAQAHVFEGWFGSEDDFQAQRAAGLLSCPVCGDPQVEKRLSAPRLNLRGAEPAAPAVEATGGERVPAAEPAAAGWVAEALRAVREIVAHTEDVGDRFAQEARRMHHGETEARGIRGRASLVEASELVEEGIAIVPLPDLPALKETLQ